MDDEQEYIGPGHDIVATQELPRELFLKWWGALAHEDREEFQYVYQGDEILARFVCVLDTLIMKQVKGDEQSIIGLAYFIAAKPFPEHKVSMDNPALRTRAARAWKEPAVEALLDRVRWRATQRRVLRVQNLLARNLEQILEDSHKVDEESGRPIYNMKDRTLAAQAGLKFLEITQDAEMETRIQRTKLGIENARKALSANAEEADPKVLEAYMKLGAKMLGKAKAEEIINNAN